MVKRRQTAPSRSTRASLPRASRTVDAGGRKTAPSTSFDEAAALNEAAAMEEIVNHPTRTPPPKSMEREFMISSFRPGGGPETGFYLLWRREARSLPRALELTTRARREERILVLGFRAGHHKSHVRMKATSCLRYRIAIVE